MSPVGHVNIHHPLFQINVGGKASRQSNEGVPGDVNKYRVRGDLKCIWNLWNLLEHKGDEQGLRTEEEHHP